MSSQQVLVIGGGLSGLSAAHTLLERGCSVLLLDKNGYMGGNSTKATSGINGSGTVAQSELNIPDTAKIFFDDTKASAKDLARDPLIKVLTGKSGDAVNWLTEKFDLDLSKVSRLGGHSQPRTHRGGAQFPGMTITYAQMERLEDLAESIPDRVTIKKKARVTQLIKEGGKVIGVEYQHDGKTEKAYGPVILATGGYAGDFEKEGSLLKKYRPDIFDLPTTNGDHCTGDGHKMSMAIGARGIDLEKVQVHPTGLVDPKDPGSKVKFLAAEALRGVGGLLLNAAGQRFCDELGRRDYVTGEMNKDGTTIRLILNGQASKEIEWHCKHYVGRGLMKRFETGEELAKEMNVSPDVLKKTFDAYNKISSGQDKDPYGKKFFPGGEFKLEDFFHVALMTPVLHYTMGGLEIDTETRVIDESGNAIPGLFASGEIAGGVHGANRLGGSSLLGCVVFGRVAGDAASAYLMQNMAPARANDRLAQVSGHLMQAKVTVAPGSSVKIEFGWTDGEGSSSASSSSSGASQDKKAETAVQKDDGDRTVAMIEPETRPEPATKSDGKKAYTMEEVAKHNTPEDCWVVVSGEVLDVTSFAEDHPGGAKALYLYAGKDATEEFLMLHDPKVIPKYAPQAVIGTVKV